jgi:NifU-like protein involved in Fe-S cluster formation
MNVPDDFLYRRALLRLAADAAGAGHLPHADGTATARNPTCGDTVTVELALAEGRVTGLAHTTQACVLTQASAAVLASEALGRDRRGLEALAAAVAAMLEQGTPLPAYAALDGTRDHPGRHRCVLLPIEAALSAFQDAEPGR